MNKKHKLLHRNNEYITSKLEIIYEEDIQRIIEEKNNLQSKIDKARKIIDRYSRVVDYDDEVSIDVLYEIDNVLKENRI